MSKEKSNRCFGFVNIFGNICNVNTAKNRKGWNYIPEEYKTEANFEMFCYLNDLRVDALSVFIDKIREHKKDQKWLPENLKIEVYAK